MPQKRRELPNTTAPAMQASVADAVPALPDKRLALTVDEVAKLLGLSRATAYLFASRGDFPTIRIGRRLLVPKAALEKMLSVGAS